MPRRSWGDARAMAEWGRGSGASPPGFAIQTRKLPAQFRLAAPAVAMEILYFLVIVRGIIAFGYFVLIALLSEFIPAPRLGERCTRSLAHSARTRAPRG